MNLYYIQLLGLFILIISCLISTYTDIKYRIIPNKLTIPLGIIGLVLVSSYYYFINNFNLFYYVSIIVIYIISYIFWFFGVWGGGDVKLFTAISTLLIPEFLIILPNYYIGSICLPIFSLKSIPTLYLMINSILSVVPIILIIVTYIIFKRKSYLIKNFRETMDLNNGLIIINSVMITLSIMKIFDVHDFVLNIIFLMFITYLHRKVVKKYYLLIIISLTILIYQILTNNTLLYIKTFIFINLIIIIKNIISNNLIKEALTDTYKINQLKEGMILSYPLCRNEKEYYFDKSTIKDKIMKNINQTNNDKIIISKRASGLTVDDINLLNKLNNQKLIENSVNIKKELSFAPFIFVGLIITFLIGNPYKFIILIMGMI
ncbi:MAG: hypothetical protein E7Z84_04125 [Methanosphaera stadtmanae]|nr:hypothetical protein [Methanosphaera stadtmanae]